MLRNDLYTIDTAAENNSVLLVSVRLNANHSVFKGHFPDHPVLPGVCMLEMVREILEISLHEKLRISKGPLIKFLSMIVPDKSPVVSIEV
ncbi:MAG TPA: 3-hydroxyacyl-ACP dehydratase, partial [Puia sp.]